MVCTGGGVAGARLDGGGASSLGPVVGEVDLLVIHIFYAQHQIECNHRFAVRLRSRPVP